MDNNGNKAVVIWDELDAAIVFLVVNFGDADPTTFDRMYINLDYSNDANKEQMVNDLYHLMYEVDEASGDKFRHKRYSTFAEVMSVEGTEGLPVIVCGFIP